MIQPRNCEMPLCVDPATHKVYLTDKTYTGRSDGHLEVVTCEIHSSIVSNWILEAAKDSYS